MAYKKIKLEVCTGISAFVIDGEDEVMLMRSQEIPVELSKDELTFSQLSRFIKKIESSFQTLADIVNYEKNTKNRAVTVDALMDLVTVYLPEPSIFYVPVFDYEKVNVASGISVESIKSSFIDAEVFEDFNKIEIVDKIPTECAEAANHNFHNAETEIDDGPDYQKTSYEDEENIPIHQKYGISEWKKIVVPPGTDGPLCDSYTEKCVTIDKKKNILTITEIKGKKWDSYDNGLCRILRYEKNSVPIKLGDEVLHYVGPTRKKVLSMPSVTMISKMEKAIIKKLGKLFLVIIK